MKKTIIVFISSFLYFLYVCPLPLAKIEAFHESDTLLSLTIHIPVPPGHVLYREYLNISVDHPEVTLSAWKADRASIVVFDTMLKKDKQVFTGDVILTLKASLNAGSNAHAHVHIAYLTSLNRQIQHQIFPLVFQPRGETVVLEPAIAVRSQNIPVISVAKLFPTKIVANQPEDKFWSYWTALCLYIDHILAYAWICQLLSIFLLFEGFLLLYKAKKDPSYSKIYGGSLCIILAILIISHGYSIS